MKTVKKIKLTPHETRNYLMMMYGGGDNNKFEKFYEFTRTELCNFIRRVYYPGELCRDVVTADIIDIMQEVYRAIAELKLKGKMIPKYGDFLLHMFEIADDNRGVCTTDEDVKDSVPAIEGHSEYDFFVQRVWPKLTQPKRSVLELWMEGFSSSAIGDTVGEDPDKVGWMIGTTLQRIQSMMKELMMDRYSVISKKMKGISRFDRVSLRESLRHEYPAEIELLKKLPSTRLPDKWDKQLLAEIKDHLALIERKLSG